MTHAYGWCPECGSKLGFRRLDGTWDTRVLEDVRGVSCPECGACWPQVDWEEPG